MKRLLLILTMFCLASTSWAEQITREQALRQAQQFLNQNGKGAALTMAETSMSKARRRGQHVSDYYYVFNVGQNLGYVVVSGDDRTAPILGYSEHGTFDVDKIPCNMAAWLQGYADQIKYIQEHPEAQVTRGDVPTHADVSSLISTTWGQNAPYNNLLPSVGGRKCVTGCGATAMAQIMNFHGAPAGCSGIPGYTTSTHSIVCDALPATTFNWGNMGSDDEVAKLMQYCAYALQADLDPSGTSAFDNMIVSALTGYFGYGSGVQEAYHSTYGDADWDMLIYNEIANSRPVILIGQSPTAGGHFFILHGYTVSGGVGYYTVNWGWNGFEDGNFLLSAMDPASVGAGFNDNQAVIVGISTSDVTPYQVEETAVLTSDDFSLNEGEKEYSIPAGYSQFGPIYFNYRFSNNLTRSYNFEINFKVYKDGEFMEMLLPDDMQIDDFGPRLTISGSFGQYLPVFDGVSLRQAFATPGTYKIVPVSREKGSSEWIDLINSDKQFVTGVVTSDMKLKMYEGDPAGSGPTPPPTPEVTQADLNELAASLTAQKDAIDAKIAAIAANDAKLDAISESLNEKKTAIDALETLIKAIEAKLNNEYLTADQKKEYRDQLDVLKSSSTAQKTAYDNALSDMSALKSTSASLKSTLNGLLTSVNSENAAISSITTKATLATSQSNIANIATQQSGCDVNAETTKVSALDTTVKAISVSGIKSDLTTLDSAIDTAIAAAKEANEEEAKAKLEAAKKELLAAYNKLSAELSQKQNALADYEKTIASLESDIKKAQDAIDPVEKEIAAIKENLKNDMLTAGQKSDFESKLEALDKEKSDYADAVNTLSERLALVSKANEQLKEDLAEIEKLISQGKVRIDDLTITTLAEATKASQDAVNKFNGMSITEQEKDLMTIKADLEKLSLENTVKELAALADDVDKAIAEGNEAYEKQQAEKLAKAKEECQNAIDKLDELVKNHQADYDKLKDAQEDMKAKMKELDDVMAELNNQYADIEKMLNDLIAKQTSDQAADKLEKLKESLKNLADNIAVLESQRQKISDQIEQLEGEMEQYASVIDTASATLNQLKTSLASAAAIADVESLTASVTKAYNTLSHDGVATYNLYVENYSTVIKNLNIYIDNVNIVDKQADSLEAAVEQETTAIQRVMVDESEVMGRYDMKGNPVDSTYKGIQIIRLKNGKTIKINVK